MNYKIVSDSSSNMFTYSKTDYVSVPLKVISSEKEYIDNTDLDVLQMVEDLKSVKGAVKTSCPNTQDWLEAFGDATEIFALAITSQLSGSYNSALLAKEQFIEENPHARICVIDSYSVSGEMQLMIEKLGELIEAGKEFEDIEKELNEYKDTTHLIFALRSLSNLARNGRVSHTIAAVAGVLGIRMVGCAKEGNLSVTDKVRGEKKTISTILNNMRECGYTGGKVRISHCDNPDSAESLKENILREYPNADIDISPCGALCSFYAEDGGLLVGYEGSHKH